MFKQTKMLFLYAVTPVHVGAGQAIGVIDNPIQRERHTNHPVIAGSGLKGAVRHQALSMEGWDKAVVNRLFGPTDGQLHAGAVSFGDAQLVAFPVRNLRQAFVYAVSPTTLARLKRLAVLAGVPADWDIPEPASGQALITDERVLSREKLVLEAFELNAQISDALQTIAAWLAQVAIPAEAEQDYFRAKLKTDLVLLPDDAFSHFVEHATVVEPHVRINDETGAADGGGLFYTENMPPESLLVAPVFSSDERSGVTSDRLDAEQVMVRLENGLRNHLLQVGGDATTGRGQMLLHFAQ